MVNIDKLRNELNRVAADICQCKDPDERERLIERADEIVHLISTLPIEIIPADLELTKQAAEFKAGLKISYADCFAAALAKLHRAELVTGDEEFKQTQEEIKLLWIS